MGHINSNAITHMVLLNGGGYVNTQHKNLAKTSLHRTKIILSKIYDLVVQSNLKF